MIFEYYYHCLIDNKHLRIDLLFHLYIEYHIQYECVSQWLSVTKKSNMLRLNRWLGRQGAKDMAVFCPVDMLVKYSAASHMIRTDERCVHGNRRNTL